jgi:3',5'-cyclic AMP phosphodiesterase CpdA
MVLKKLVSVVALWCCLTGTSLAQIGQATGPKGMFQPIRGDVRIAVISDLNASYGSTDYEPQVLKTIKLLPEWRPDLVICSGDMVAGQDPSLSKERIQAMWSAFGKKIAFPIRKAGIPYGFTFGNHDASSAVGIKGGFLFQKERDLASSWWNGPGQDTGVQFIDRSGFPFYYTFTQNGVFFLIWDASSNRIPPEQLAWAEKALASTTAQNAKMRLVIGHLPLYSVAIGRNEFGEVLDNADSLRAMLEKYRVHTYISGHHHAYYPAHRGNLQLLHTSALGSGPRPLIDGNGKTTHTFTVLDINFKSPELTTYTTYDMRTQAVIDPMKLPRTIVGVNGMVLRRDMNWKDLTKAELNRCTDRLSASQCKP